MTRHESMLEAVYAARKEIETLRGLGIPNEAWTPALTAVVEAHKAATTELVALVKADDEKADALNALRALHDLVATTVTYTSPGYELPGDVQQLLSWGGASALVRVSNKRLVLVELDPMYTDGRGRRHVRRQKYQVGVIGLDADGDAAIVESVGWFTKFEQAIEAGRARIAKERNQKGN